MRGIKEKLLAIAIGIVFVLFAGYGINTFYPGPEYSDFCESEITKSRELVNDEENCLDKGGKWESYPRPIEGEDIKGYCDQDFTCREEYNDVRNLYNRNVFIAASIIGVIAIILGGVVLSIESVSSGLMGGGILTIIYGTLRYWGQLGDIGRFLTLGSVLGILIWLGYKKLNK